MDDYEDPEQIIREAFELRSFTVELLRPIILAARVQNARLVDFWTSGENHSEIGGIIRVALQEDAGSVGEVVSTLLSDYQNLQLSLTVNVAPYNAAADVGFSSNKSLLWYPGQPSLDALRPDR